MKTIVNGVWVPDSKGNWHHFVITRRRPAHGGDRVRVAYTSWSFDMSYSTTFISAEADSAASWYLSPDASKAWREQRAAGWDGTAASMEAV
jgi:hypothetical protein